MRFLKRKLYVDYDQELRDIWVMLIMLIAVVIVLSVITLINTLRAETAEASVKTLPEAQNSLIRSDNVKVEELPIEDYIRQQASISGVNPDLAVSIAKCESSLNPKAKHLISSATGLYQFTSGTWKWIKADGERTDYKASTREFLKWFPVYPGWWEDCL